MVAYYKVCPPCLFILNGPPYLKQLNLCHGVWALLVQGLGWTCGRKNPTSSWFLILVSKKYFQIKRSVWGAKGRCSNFLVSTINPSCISIRLLLGFLA